MGPFFDLHSHMLCGVDDGAHDQEMMFAMLDIAYADGIRAICLTPHYSPYLFGDTFERSKRSYAVLSEYAAQKYPEMKLFLGHELGYYHGCERALGAGRCRTIAGGRYVLVDFLEHIDFFEINRSMNHLRNIGYIPVLAHAERYRCLSHNIPWVKDFVLAGGLVQVNAQSFIGGLFSPQRSLAVRLLRQELVHVIASDGHDAESRPPLISVCMELLKKYCTQEKIRELTWDNPRKIVENQIF